MASISFLNENWKQACNKLEYFYFIAFLTFLIYFIKPGIEWTYPNDWILLPSFQTQQRKFNYALRNWLFLLLCRLVERDRLNVPGIAMIAFRLICISPRVRKLNPDFHRHERENIWRLFALKWISIGKMNEVPIVNAKKLREENMIWRKDGNSEIQEVKGVDRLLR